MFKLVETLTLLSWGRRCERMASSPLQFLFPDFVSGLFKVLLTPAACTLLLFNFWPGFLSPGQTGFTGPLPLTFRFIRPLCLSAAAGDADCAGNPWKGDETGEHQTIRRPTREGLLKPSAQSAARAAAAANLCSCWL